MEYKYVINEKIQPMEILDTVSDTFRRRAYKDVLGKMRAGFSWDKVEDACLSPMFYGMVMDDLHTLGLIELVEMGENVVNKQYYIFQSDFGVLELEINVDGDRSECLVFDSYVELYAYSDAEAYKKAQYLFLNKTPIIISRDKISNLVEILEKLK